MLSQYIFQESMAKLNSFISEHSAEYFLLSDLTPILLAQFRLVIPFYFWSGREGSNLSRSLGGANQYKCIAIFPRRPKLNASNQNEIYIKFNESISPIATYFINNNIPVVAGMPNALSVADLNLNGLSCTWFQLIGSINYDAEYNVNKAQGQLLKSNGIKGPISKVQICQLLKEVTFMTWEEIIDVIRKSRNSENQNHRRSIYGWYSNYKPIFIIVADEY